MSITNFLTWLFWEAHDFLCIWWWQTAALAALGYLCAMATAVVWRLGVADVVVRKIGGKHG